MSGDDYQFNASEGGVAGLAYADGVFETMRSHHGTIPLWPQHRARLSASLTRLGLDQPRWSDLAVHLQNVASQHSGAVIKLISYSAEAGRGYRRANSSTRVWVQVHRLPEAQQRVEARTAELRIASGGDLAGLKTLCRLEQRIAATTVAGADVAMLRNRDGHWVSFSHGNLFLDYGDHLCTPPLSHGAIAGVIRGMLIDRGPVSIKVGAIPYERLSRAKAVLLTNAVRGVQSVTRLDTQPLPESPVAGQLQRWLTEQGLPPLNQCG